MPQKKPTTSSRPRTAADYALAVAAIAVATLLRLLLDPALGDHFPVITYFVAVLLVAWGTSLWPSVFALLLGALAGDFFFVAPRYSLAFHLSDAASLADFARYMIVGIAMIVVCEAMRRARLRAEAHPELLRITLASIGEGVITTDARGKVDFQNPVAQALTGWTPEEVVGRSLTEIFRIVDQQTRAEVENPVLRALREGVSVGRANHTILIARDGTERYIEDSAAPIQSEAGEIAGAVLVFRDISARHAAEASSARLAAIVTSSKDAIISKDMSGVITSWNKGAELLFGYSAAEAVGKSVSLLIPDDHADEEPKILERIRKGEVIDQYETVRCRKGGGLVDISLTVSPIMDAAGQIVGAFKIARDITERRRAEALVRVQKQSLASIVQGEPFEQVLDFLARSMESLSPSDGGGFVVAIHLLEPDGHHFGHVTAPSLPAGYAQATKGMDARRELGCCSSAVVSRTPTVVRDFADPLTQTRWPAFSAEVASLGIRSCFTTPILSSPPRRESSGHPCHLLPKAARPQPRRSGVGGYRDPHGGDRDRAQADRATPA